MRRAHKLWLYFALAFGISWTGVLLTDTRELRFVAMLAGPAFACLALILVLEKPRGLRRLAQRLLRWPALPAWFAAPVVAPLILLTVLVVLGFASPAFMPAIFAGGDVGSTIAVAVLGGVIGGFFEELGWTGYATPRLLRRYSWFDAGLILGVPWALWHMLPDFLGNYASYGSLWFAHAALWFVALTAFRVFMTWAYRHTHSLPLAMLLHATFTGSQLLLIPVSAAVVPELIWYGLFAVELWLLVAFVALVGDVFASVAASKQERVRPLLGDVLVQDPMISVTHAITIDRPPAMVWPWLSQMGSDRAGWYSWDRIDNAGAHSSDRLIAAYQQVEPGDVMPALPGEIESFVVAAVEPGRDLLLTVPGEHGTIVSWEHYLEPDQGGRTRLIVRGRASRELGDLVLGRVPNVLRVPLAKIGHRWMEARHMRGIKRRVEAYS
jgi:membrane protease YdiL (CAAX protease family)